MDVQWMLYTEVMYRLHVCISYNLYLPLLKDEFNNFVTAFSHLTLIFFSMSNSPPWKIFSDLLHSKYLMKPLTISNLGFTVFSQRVPISSILVRRSIIYQQPYLMNSFDVWVSTSCIPFSSQVHQSTWQGRLTSLMAGCLSPLIALTLAIFTIPSGLRNISIPQFVSKAALMKEVNLFWLTLELNCWA